MFIWSLMCLSCISIWSPGCGCLAMPIPDLLCLASLPIWSSMSPWSPIPCPVSYALFLSGVLCIHMCVWYAKCKTYSCTHLYCLFILISVVVYLTPCSGHVLSLVNRLCLSRNATKKATPHLGIEPLISNTTVHCFTS